MKEVTKIVFERDSHIIFKIDEAFRLVGGADWDEKDERRKPFRRIHGNDATRSDCYLAVEIIKSAARSEEQRARTAPCPFPEQEPGSSRVEETWREGQLRGIARAVAKAESFIAEIEIGLSQNNQT